MRVFRVLVCGSRSWADGEFLDSVLGRVKQIANEDGFALSICHGGARGADRLADAWAKAHHVTHRPYPADWDTHGKAAGAIRNRQMLKDFKPNLVIAFRSPGESRGTDDMVDAATKAGVPCSVFSTSPTTTRLP